VITRGLGDIMLRLFGNPLFVACSILAVAFLGMTKMAPEYRWGELLELLRRFMQIYFPFLL
jgi:hypothetical protein